MTFALGQAFELPTTPPPFQASVPDGHGGWVTIGTIAPAPAKLAETGPSVSSMQWAQYGSTLLGILVAAATLYVMFHHRKGLQS